MKRALQTITSALNYNLNLEKMQDLDPKAFWL